MNDDTKIEWCDATLNPFGWGCTGPEGTPEEPNPCRYCYAKRMACRNVRECPKCRAFVPHDDHIEAEMAKWRDWKRPRRVFIQSMGDPFDPLVEDRWLQIVMSVIYAWPRHTAIMLTKRPERARQYFAGRRAPKNLWLGVSATNQIDLEKRLEVLFQINVKRLASIEPMLHRVNLWDTLVGNRNGWLVLRGLLHWVIVGGLTGEKPKPAPVESLTLIEEQCQMAMVPLFVKDNAGYPRTVRQFPECTPLAVANNVSMLRHPRGSPPGPPVDFDQQRAKFRQELESPL